MRLEHLLSGSSVTWLLEWKKKKMVQSNRLSPILLAIGYAKHKRKMKPSSSEIACLEWIFSASPIAQLVRAPH